MDAIKINRAAFARLMGVNKGTVTKWIEAGRVEVVDGLIDVEAAKRRLAATENTSPQAQAQIERHAADKAASAKAIQDGRHVPNLEKIRAATKLADYKLRQVMAEKAGLELDKAVGLLVERSEVDYVLADLGNTLRSSLESLADRLAPAIAVHRGDVAAIHAEIEGVSSDLLHEISDKMRRWKESCAA